MRPPLGRSFWLVFAGEAASSAGTAASVIALPVVALNTTHDVRQAGLTGTALSLGILVARLPAGLIADWCDRRRVMLLGDLLGAAVLTSLAVLTWYHRTPLPALLTVAALLGAVGSTLAPAENAAVRDLVPSERLPHALALTQSRAFVALVAGPLAGGLMLAVDAFWVFAADAATYLVAAACLAAVRTDLRTHPPARPGLRAAVDGLRFLWHSPFLRYAAVNSTIVNLVFNGLLVVVVAAADEDGGGTLGIGAQTAALGVGGLVGSVAAVPAAKRLSPSSGTAVSTAVIALALLLFATFRSSWFAGAFLALASATGPVVAVVVSSAQMRITPRELQGRVHSAVGFLAQTMAPLGPALAGLSAHAWGVTPTVVGAAVVVFLLALAAPVMGRSIGVPPHPVPERSAPTVETPHVP